MCANVKKLVQGEKLLYDYRGVSRLFVEGRGGGGGVTPISLAVFQELRWGSSLSA